MSLINKMNVGNTDYDIQDRLMPDAIGQAGQVLKVKDDRSGLEFSTIESGGGKLYLHSLYFVSVKNQSLLTFYHTSPTQVTDEWIYENLTNNNCCLTFFPTVTSISQYDTIGLGAQLGPTGSSPSWGASIDLESPSTTTLSVSQADQYIVTEL